MRALFYLSLFMLVYGSLYPFTYGFTPLDQIDWFPDTATVSKADILGNVALCIPAGLFGALYGMEKRYWFWIRLTLTVLFAVLVQFAQIFIAGRVPSMLDVVFNLIGLGAGLIAAFCLRGFLKRFPMALPPIVFMLLGAFLIYQLIPFVPSLDWGLIKGNLKSSLAASENFSLESMLRYLAYWFTLGAVFLAGARDQNRTGWIFGLLLLGAFTVFPLRILILKNDPTLAQFLGALLGSMLFLALTKLREKRIYLAIGLILLVLLNNGLTPFIIRDEAQMISLMPFGGFLSGSMLANLIALSWKLFIYSQLIFLLIVAGLAPWRAGGAVAILLMAMEAAQIFLASGTPEITDPLLAILLGLIMPGLMQAGNQRSTA